MDISPVVFFSVFFFFVFMDVDFASVHRNAKCIIKPCWPHAWSIRHMLLSFTSQLHPRASYSVMTTTENLINNHGLEYLNADSSAVVFCKIFLKFENTLWPFSGIITYERFLRKCSLYSTASFSSFWLL